MSSRLSLEHTTVETLPTTITSRLDPTGDTVEFNMTAATLTSPSGSWTAGTWNGTWNSTTGEVVALSPLIGSGAFVLTEGTFYKLWVRWVHGSETIVALAATIHAT